MIFGTKTYITGVSCLKCGGRLRMAERLGVSYTSMSESYRVACKECWWSYIVEVRMDAYKREILASARSGWAAMRLREL